MKAILTILGVFAVIGVVVFGINAIGFASFAFWAPKYEGVRRDVVVQSRANTEGTFREMYRLKLQYQRATTQEEKNTIKAFTLHEVQSFDRARLPADIKDFIAQLEAN